MDKAEWSVLTLFERGEASGEVREEEEAEVDDDDDENGAEENEE